MDILIIEDSFDIADMLMKFLKKAGYTSYNAKSGEEGLEYIKYHDVKIVLLDIMLPGIDGFQVCKKISDEKNLPLIILSAKTDKDDKLSGLILGADDYIEKPFDVDLLIAKVSSLYRRHYKKDPIIKVPDIKIDIEARSVTFKKIPLELNVKEFDLLLLLVQSRGKALRKEYILGKVWGMDNFSEPQTLTVHINRLREKIEDDPRKPTRIVTVWGVGYKFV
ncbi:MAG: response regulator transcription factor [Oscillospiraceae bacterium]|nr:response regulator transcription factor [Oscillospiraceae bacterium]